MPDLSHPLGGIHAAVWQFDRWEELRRAWADPASHQYYSLFPMLLILACVLAAVASGLWLWERHKHRHLRSTPLRTFHHAAQTVGLGLSDQWLLARIARSERLISPLTLLLSSATLDHHARRYLDTLSPRRRGRFQARIDQIGGMLFGGREAHENRD
jgi:hypothetical protein